MTADQEAQCIALRARDKTYQAIADEVGTTQSTVHKFLKHPKPKPLPMSAPIAKVAAPNRKNAPARLLPTRKLNSFCPTRKFKSLSIELRGAPQPTKSQMMRDLAMAVRNTARH
jgi:hypothetical protein